jgi:hypothetical protein
MIETAVGLLPCTGLLDVGSGLGWLAAVAGGAVGAFVNTATGRTLVGGVPRLAFVGAGTAAG